MELRLDPASAVPLYAQVVEQIRALVASRAYRPGDRLPSVRELAASLRLNRNTVAKAYQALEIGGVIETRAGQGCFVANGSPRWTHQERMRRLHAALDRAVVEARHMEIPLEDLSRVLSERISAFQRPSQPSRDKKGR